jgi:hypothetical protein
LIGVLEACSLLSWKSLNGEETVIQRWEIGYYPGRWKNLTKEAFTAHMPN